MCRRGGGDHLFQYLGAVCFSRITKRKIVLRPRRPVSRVERFRHRFLENLSKMCGQTRKQAMNAHASKQLSAAELSSSKWSIRSVLDSGRRRRASGPRRSDGHLNRPPSSGRCRTHLPRYPIPLLLGYGKLAPSVSPFVAFSLSLSLSLSLTHTYIHVRTHKHTFAEASPACPGSRTSVTWEVSTNNTSEGTPPKWNTTTTCWREHPTLRNTSTHAGGRARRELETTKAQPAA